MSNLYLPPEMIDNIVDFLRDDPETLKECCVVSKSWVPGSRKHLFAHIRFRSVGDLESWKRAFPDPSASPAYHYAKTLSIDCLCAVAATDAEAGGWIRGFPRVTHVEVDSSREAGADELRISLVPLYGFSPSVKSLRITSKTLPSSRIFNFILSFPLLEDLDILSRAMPIDSGDGSDGMPTTVQPPSPPMFTGSIALRMRRGMGPIARRLLSLPGLHFRNLALTLFCEEDLFFATELVERCSHTLESVGVNCGAFVTLGSASGYLSKVPNLKSAVFRIGTLSVEWVTTELQSITPRYRDFKQISIHVPYHLTPIPTGADVRKTIGDVIVGEWLGLDRCLVQFWKSRSIRPRVVRTREPEGGRGNVGDFVGCLMPETTRRGIVDLVGWCTL